MSDGGLLLPKKIGLTALLAFMVWVGGGIAAWANLRHEIAELKEFKEAREARIAQEEKALHRMEFTLCRICEHTVGKDSCSSTCAKFRL